MIERLLLAFGKFFQHEEYLTHREWSRSVFFSTGFWGFFGGSRGFQGVLGSLGVLVFVCFLGFLGCLGCFGPNSVGARTWSVAAGKGWDQGRGGPENVVPGGGASFFAPSLNPPPLFIFARFWPL